MTVDLGEVISVQEASRRLNCPEPRIRQLIRNGSLAATRLGRQWLVSSAALETIQLVPQRVGRPYSQRQAWTLIRALEGIAGPEGSHRQEVARLRSYLEQPVNETQNRLRARSKTILLSVSSGMLNTLRHDSRWILGGEVAACEYLQTSSELTTLTIYSQNSQEDNFLDESFAVPDEYAANVRLKLVDDQYWPFNELLGRYVWRSVSWLDCKEEAVSLHGIDELWPQEPSDKWPKDL